MQPYMTGTITGLQGSKEITGNSTLWSNTIHEGDLLVANNKMYPIKKVTDDAHITLYIELQEALTNSAYYIARTASNWGSNADVAAKVTETMDLYKNRLNNVSGIFIQYVDQTTSAFPTTRTDGSAIKNEDYVKPSTSATFPFTISGITFKNVNDRACYNGTSWYLASTTSSTANVSVTTPATESIAGDKTTQAAVNAELVAAIKESTARYITKNAAGDQFATHAELTTATTFYYAGAVTTPDEFDYAIVTSDEDHSYAQSKYIFQPSTTAPPGTWVFQCVYSTGVADASIVATSTGIKVQIKENSGIGLDGTSTSKGIYIKIATDGGLMFNSSGELMVRHTFSSFSIATTDWTDSVNADFETNFKATITVTGLTTNDVILTYFANSCALAAGVAGILADITAADTITFYSKTKPTVPVYGKLTVVRTDL